MLVGAIAGIVGVLVAVLIARGQRRKRTQQAPKIAQWAAQRQWEHVARDPGTLQVHSVPAGHLTRPLHLENHLTGSYDGLDVTASEVIFDSPYGGDQGTALLVQVRGYAGPPLLFLPMDRPLADRHLRNKLPADILPHADPLSEPWAAWSPEGAEALRRVTSALRDWLMDPSSYGQEVFLQDGSVAVLSKTRRRDISDFDSRIARACALAHAAGAVEADAGH